MVVFVLVRGHAHACALLQTAAQQFHWSLLFQSRSNRCLPKGRVIGPGHCSSVAMRPTPFYYSTAPVMRGQTSGSQSSGRILKMGWLSKREDFQAYPPLDRLTRGQCDHSRVFA